MCVCVCCLALLVAHVKSIVRNQVEWALSAIAGFQLNKNAFTLLNLLFRWSNCFVGFNFDGIGVAKKRSPAIKIMIRSQICQKEQIRENSSRVHMFLSINTLY